MDRRMFLYSGGALFLAPALMAAEDLTGKWSGSFAITFSDGDKRFQGLHGYKAEGSGDHGHGRGESR